MGKGGKTTVILAEPRVSLVSAQDLLTQLSTLSSLLRPQQGRDMQPILRPSIHAVTKEVRGKRGRQVGLGSLSSSAMSGA